MVFVHGDCIVEEEAAQGMPALEAVVRCVGDAPAIGQTGEQERPASQDNRIDLQIVKLPEVEKGFVLLPKRWVVERSFGFHWRRLHRPLREAFRGEFLLRNFAAISYARKHCPACLSTKPEAVLGDADCQECTTRHQHMA